VFVTLKNNPLAIKRPHLIAKKQKKSSFYKEKSLVGLTPFFQNVAE
jgi:hypothetical protein